MSAHLSREDQILLLRSYETQLKRLQAEARVMETELSKHYDSGAGVYDYDILDSMGGLLTNLSYTQDVTVNDKHHPTNVLQFRKACDGALHDACIDSLKTPEEIEEDERAEIEEAEYRRQVRADYYFGQMGRH